MEKFKKILKIIIYVIAVFTVLSSMFSLFRNAEIRYFKMLDFPRIQLFIISLICFAILIFTTNKRNWYNYIILIGLLISITINSVFLINYTPLVASQVPLAKSPFDNNNQLHLLLANVKMSNKNAKSLINLISINNPDIILAMETDSWWNNKLKVLENTYPYFQLKTNEAAYGMSLYSKFPIKEMNIEYLNNKNVPSFQSTITLPSNKEIALHCLHPVPPSHFKDLPDNANQEENALKKIGKRVQNSKLPTVIAGDLNDVVWSYVDNLTNTKNLLFDVRAGRGFYNSFSARNIFMRWPLDHVFVTKEFQLKKIKRLSKIGSDHFPIYIELALID